MAGVDVKLEGIEELTSKLRSISDDVKYKGGRFALRKAANLIRDSVKENAQRLDDPTTSESIAKNIAVRFSSRRFKRTGDILFRVGVLGGAKGITSKSGKSWPGGDTFYWRFLEFGTETIGATPFVRPGMEKNTERAINEFIKNYGPAIERAIKRAAKKMVN